MTLTVGTNSYCTLEEAEAYMAAGPSQAAWTAADSAAREAALQAAFRTLERLRYAGAVSQPTQPAQWPRRGAYDATGRECAPTRIPAFMLAAQCEEALALLTLAADAGAPTRAALQAQGVAEIAVGDLREQYGPRPRPAGLTSPQSYALIRPVLVRSPRRVWAE